MSEDFMPIARSKKASTSLGYDTRGSKDIGIVDKDYRAVTG